MSGEVRPFPGTFDVGRPSDAQPQPAVIHFLSDLLERAQRGDIQAIAVAMVKPGHETGEGYSLPTPSTHELMAAISYLQVRFACEANSKDRRDTPMPPGGA